MKRHDSIALAVLVGLTGFGCATVTPTTSQNHAQSTGQSCRTVASPDAKLNSYCGTTEQWSEFDARIAQVEQGLSCRDVGTPKALCLYAKQWKYADRRQSADFRGYGFGDDAENSARAVGYMNQTDGANQLYATELAARQPER